MFFVEVPVIMSSFATLIESQSLIKTSFENLFFKRNNRLLKTMILVITIPLHYFNYLVSHTDLIVNLCLMVVDATMVATTMGYDYGFMRIVCMIAPQDHHYSNLND